MKDLPRVTARLESLGLMPVLEQLINGELRQTETFHFSQLKTARTVRRLLYGWLYFFPIVKDRVSLRLNEATAELHIIPRGVPEKRGRKGGKL